MAVVLLVLGTAPVADWIPGGLVDPGYRQRWLEWGYGLAICAGIAVAAAIIAGNDSMRSVRLPERFRSALASFAGGSFMADGLLAVSCAVVYASASQIALDGRPLLIDEIVQVLQARLYAAGQLSVPTDSAPEFFSLLHVVDVGDRTYAQFPPGWPVMLALGSLFRAEWLAGPVCGGIAVAGFARLLRRVFRQTNPVTVTAGTLLFALSPFAVFQFASHMSHGPALMWLVLAVLGLSHLIDGSAPAHQIAIAAATGVAAGSMCAVRPLDGVAFGAPAAVWLITLVVRRRVPWRVLGAASVGAFVPVALVMWVNSRTTGSPAVFGYEVLWGASHGLGFHAAPWGDAHTPQRGLELLSLYITRLNAYLFEGPFPSLIPVIGALWLALPITATERYLVGASAVHALLYFAYWHDGFYLGPRFVLPWLPALVVLCIRFGMWVSSARVLPHVRAAVTASAVAGVLLSVAVGIPSRVVQYRSGLASMRTDYSVEAARAGVRDAVVFVRESWGAQLVSRLWAMGVSRSAAASLYRGVDACVLEHAVTAAERAELRGSRAEQALQPLLADSGRVVASNVSPDSTERMLPGHVYDSTCSARVASDRAGYALYPPFRLDYRSNNLYVRDLGARDTLIMSRFPARAYFLVFREGAESSAPLRWIRLSRDSVSASDRD